jgi:hypothetical protein
MAGLAAFASLICFAGALIVVIVGILAGRIH